MNVVGKFFQGLADEDTEECNSFEGNTSGLLYM
jgi:hypothetical protein